MVTNGEYQFVGLAAFQKQKIEVMDDKCFRDQQAAALSLHEHRPFDIITVGIQEILEEYCAIFWPAAAKMMEKFYVENKALTGRQISEAPLWLSKSTDRVVPFVFSDIGHRKTRERWTVSFGYKISFLSNMLQSIRIMLCQGEHRHKPLHTPQDSLFSEEGEFRSVLDTFAWISKRYAEITLFQYLQHAANRLNSLPPAELFDAAIGFLEILYCRLISDPGGKFNVSSLKLFMSKPNKILGQGL